MLQIIYFNTNMPKLWFDAGSLTAINLPEGRVSVCEIVTSKTFLIFIFWFLRKKLR